MGEMDRQTDGQTGPVTRTLGQLHDVRQSVQDVNDFAFFT